MAGQGGNRAPERLAALEEQRLWLEREVMERKRAEQALRESEERLHLAVRSAPVTLFTQDLNLRYTWIFNPPRGFAMDQLIGCTDDEAFGEEGAAITRFKREVIATGNRGMHEVCTTRGDGPRWFNVTADPLRLADGKLIGLICAAVEITELKQSERALKDSEARYRAMVDSLDGFVYICSEDYTIEFMNKKLVQRTGRCAVGEKCYKALHGLDHKCPWCKTDRVFAGERVRWEVQSPLDGRWYYVVNTPFERGDGSRAKMAVIFDITERKEAERRHDEVLHTMMRSHHLESLTRLTGNIAHHFNNQLTVVLGNVELVTAELPPESPLRDYLEDVRIAAERAAQLSNQMLTCSGHAFSTLQSGNLSQLVESCRALVEVTAAPRVATRYQLADPGPAVRMDARLLQQLLLNWATNSAEAVGDRQGELLIETGERELDATELARLHPPIARKPGRHAYLAVKDTGGGLAREMEKRLFDPFASTKGVGRGLGLAVSLGIASAHNGGIDVSSQPGEGCTFTLYLPLDEPDSSAG